MAASEGCKNDVGAWLPLLDEYRLTALPDETLLRGVLRQDLSPASPEVRAVLDAWDGQAHLHHEDDATDVVLIFRRGEPRRARLWLHAGLLLATLITTLAAGAMLRGEDPFGTAVLALGDLMVAYPTGLRWTSLAAGASFALPFLGVLMAHELGHFTAARVHRVRATLPYFIPFPPYLSIIGTVGAFIRLRGPTVRRAGLFDIGAAGPMASLVLSLPLLAVGLSLSEAVPTGGSMATPFMVRFVGEPVWLGGSLLTGGMALLFGPPGALSGSLVLHPLAFAGWLGLFVTALNLLPLGQLDGGHILYALMGGRQTRAAWVFLVAMFPLGFVWWGWWVWAAVVAFLHRGKMRHPPVLQAAPPVGRTRIVVGLILVAAFFVTFVPVPLSL